MKTRFAATLVVLLCTTILYRAPLVAQERADAEKSSGAIVFENDYVRVSQNAASCAAPRTPGCGTRVLVALSTVTIDSSRGAVALERGGVAVFAAAESYAPPTGEYFEVAIRPGHPPAKGPESWLEPEKNIVVYEDDELRVFEERLPPHGERSLHSHAQRLVVRLNLVQLTDPRTQKSGTQRGGVQVPNTVKFAEPVTHVVRNLSDAPLFNVVIEFNVAH